MDTNGVNSTGESNDLVSITTGECQGEILIIGSWSNHSEFAGWWCGFTMTDLMFYSLGIDKAQATWHGWALTFPCETLVSQSEQVNKPQISSQHGRCRCWQLELVCLKDVVLSKTFRIGSTSTHADDDHKLNEFSTGYQVTVIAPTQCPKLMTSSGWQMWDGTTQEPWVRFVFTYVLGCVHDGCNGLRMSMGPGSG